MSRVSGPSMSGESGFECGDDRPGIVHAQRRLRDVSERGIVWQVECRDVFDALHQSHGAVDLPHRSDYFRMIFMSNQDQRAALRSITPGMMMHLGHERAGRIEHRQTAGGCFLLDMPCNAMGAENGWRVRRNFMQFLDKDGALRLQAFDDMFVMNDFVTYMSSKA